MTGCSYDQEDFWPLGLVTIYICDQKYLCPVLMTSGTSKKMGVVTAIPERLQTVKRDATGAPSGWTSVNQRNFN